LENTYDEVLEDIAWDKSKRKACKADDAAVPEYLWEEHLLNGLEKRDWDDANLQKLRRLSQWLRSKMLQWWKRNVTISYIKWAAAKYELMDTTTPIKWVTWNGNGYEWTGTEGRGNYRSWWKQCLLITHQDFVPASDAIQRGAKTLWWGWDAGSCPFHWRSRFYQDVIRDGLKVHFQEPPPKCLKSQRDIRDDDIKLQVIKKLLKVRQHGYIDLGLVELLTAFFEVPKGEDDICLVYDGSISGLNLSI
jgi:hypothetical protein